MPRAKVLNHSYHIPQARLRDVRQWELVVALAAAAVIQLSIKHLGDIYLKASTNEALVTLLWTVVFIIIAHELVMSWFERPFRADDPELRRRVEAYKVVVNVPVHNEGEVALDRALYALSTQTRHPDVIHVVDDGSTTSTYDEIRDHWSTAFADLGVDFRWTRTPNQLKRRAQMVTFAQPTDPDDPREEILVTMDSDTALDRNAIAEGLLPFARSDVYSVAGFELTYNMHTGGRNGDGTPDGPWWKRPRGRLFTMVGAMSQNMWQLNTCAAQNITGRVQVNRGTLAFYRAVVFRDHVEDYLNENWFGRRVEFSDDSRATLTAQRYGRTVQQPSCFQFTLTPVTWHHAVKQRLRWMRGSQLRDITRLRELPKLTYAFWMVIIKWVQFFLATATLVFALATVHFTPEKVAYFIVMPLLIAYLCGLRYLSLERSDEGILRQLAAVAIAPLVIMRSATIFKVVRLYAMVTFLKVQTWGTRSRVEVDAVRTATVPGARTPQLGEDAAEVLPDLPTPREPAPREPSTATDED